jgi:predicted AAA+ superfamily ATPase
MYIPRKALKQLESLEREGKVIVIYGPRRVGKTTLLKKYLEDKQDYLFVTGEDIFVHEFLSSNSVEKLKNFIGNKKRLVIDEAQCVPSIGKNLKLIVDHIPDIRVIVTGSATLDLTQATSEPLTGRKHSITMFPIAQVELCDIENQAESRARLDERLIFGSYPEVIGLEGDDARKENLHELVSSYLFKDILALEGIKKTKKLLDLLVLLTFQIGKEVSHNELATQLSMSKTTVEKYLDLFEKTFVLINIRGFSKNLRSEVTKSSRYYFCDNGIRNALINNFNPLSLRNDVGALWENYLVMERIKRQNCLRQWSNNYFWRTYDQKEIDFVEERDGKIFGYEFKWGKSDVKAPALWQKTYPDASFECINQNNYFSFIT